MDVGVTTEKDGESKNVMHFLKSSSEIHLIGQLRLWKHWVLSSFWILLPHLLCPIRFASFVFSFRCRLYRDSAHTVLCLRFLFVNKSSSQSKYRGSSALHSSGCHYLCMYFSWYLFVSFSPLCHCQPWMKDVLYFLRSRLPQASDALKRKLFELTTTSNAARKKRTGKCC